jgi:hypothetical protein
MFFRPNRRIRFLWGTTYFPLLDSREGSTDTSSSLPRYLWGVGGFFRSPSSLPAEGLVSVSFPFLGSYWTGSGWRCSGRRLLCRLRSGAFHRSPVPYSPSVWRHSFERVSARWQGAAVRSLGPVESREGPYPADQGLQARRWGSWESVLTVCSPSRWRAVKRLARMPVRLPDVWVSRRFWSFYVEAQAIAGTFGRLCWPRLWWATRRPARCARARPGPRAGGLRSATRAIRPRGWWWRRPSSGRRRRRGHG